MTVSQPAGPTNDDTEALAKLMLPVPAERLVARPVSTAVKSTHNDGPALTIRDQVVG